MTKRIVSDGNHFYPQRKGWFGWKFYYERGQCCIDGLEMGDSIIRFYTLQEAIDFMLPAHPIKVVWEAIEKP